MNPQKKDYKTKKPQGEIRNAKCRVSPHWQILEALRKKYSACQIISKSGLAKSTYFRIVHNPNTKLSHHNFIRLLALYCQNQTTNIPPAFQEMEIQKNGKHSAYS